MAQHLRHHNEIITAPTALLDDFSSRVSSALNLNKENTNSGFDNDNSNNNNNSKKRGNKSNNNNDLQHTNSLVVGKVAQQLAELVDANNNQLTTTGTSVNSGMGSRMKKRFKLSKKVKHSLKSKVSCLNFNESIINFEVKALVKLRRSRS